jgi:hypothetical protein
MKTITIVSLLVLGVGIYLEYQKDSSFASVDTGSILIGTGAGMILGSMI